jgi:anti-anti-sigma regulatory factor
VRFIGDFSVASLHPFPDILRQIMRRAPSFIHLDLREVTAVDDGGVEQLAHSARICRRHGGLVKISVSPPVERAVEAAGAGAALGIVPKIVRERLSARADGGSPKGSLGPAPHF